jgi:ankyrin repeat protein
MWKYIKLLLIGMFSLLVIVQICICAYHYFATKDLLQAIENEDTIKVEQLLKEGADPNMLKVPPSKLWTFLEYSQDWPLSIACETGNLKIVELLIDHGAIVEPSAEEGLFTPLQATLFYFQPDDPEIVALLLENGAKTEYSQNEKAVISAARMKPCVYDKTKANGTVFSSGYDESTAMGITKIVDMLLGGKDIDVKTGVALLTASIKQENLFLTKYLLTKGCDPNETDSRGKSPLDYALESNNADLVSLLQNSWQ